MGKDDLEKYKCDTCEKTILNQRALKDHQLVHKDMKEIMCSYDNFGSCHNLAYPDLTCLDVTCPILPSLDLTSPALTCPDFTCP